MKLINIVILYLFIINIFCFFIFAIDKQKAKHRRSRISERTLLGVSFLGGSIGGLIGMEFFRHKTIKPMFVIGMRFMVIIHIVIFIYLLVVMS